MGLKVDSSFLRFLTMGALGVRRVQELMRERGLEPIELERSSASNKIWMTKVKRLRVADLLCVKTGLRIEVRAKSNLALKMSDAPNNSDRRWNSGLSRRDMIAFVKIFEENGQLVPAANAELFWVEDLETTENLSKLGPPKSASEGAERDREWPSTVPRFPGRVTDVNRDRIAARLSAGRNQSYRLNGKHPYVGANEEFAAESQFIAGIPQRKAEFPDGANSNWDPRPLLTSQTNVDRYVAVKALGYVGETNDKEALFQVANSDSDKRVALEAAGSLARLGDERSIGVIQNIIEEPDPEFLRMECALILAELVGTPLQASAAELLFRVAEDPRFAGNEVRQAAIWGLGKAGHREYGRLVTFFDRDNAEERIHAMTAIGADAGAAVVPSFTDILCRPDSSDTCKAAAAYVLSKVIPVSVSVPALIAAFQRTSGNEQSWIVATIGQIAGLDRSVLPSDPVLRAQLETLQLLSPAKNWTKADEYIDKISFVSRQQF